VLALTIDVDWAPDLIMDEVVALFDEHAIPLTLLCTDPTSDASGNSSVLLGRYGPQHELGLHPNFQHRGDYRVVWDNLLRQYPDAKGWRSHNGVTGWPIQAEGVARGLRYEIYCTVYPLDVPPFKVNRDVLDLHIFTTRFFDSQMMTVAGYDWSFDTLGLSLEAEAPDRLVIMGFHPNIIYYDIAIERDYQARKSSYHVPQPADGFRTRPASGPVKLIREIAERFPSSTFTTVGAFARCRGLIDTI
jgi:hypothetical protein